MMNFLTQLAQETQIKISAGDIGISKTALDETTLASVLNTVYMWAGIVAIVVIIIGGIRYTTSNGDAGQVKSAKNTILYAVVGLIVIIMAAAITQFVIRGTAGSGSEGGSGNASQQTTQPSGAAASVDSNDDQAAQ